MIPTNSKAELERAKELYYSGRLQEGYNIFRRYYDRIPFKPEPDHAKYIGMFIRTLLELGKEFEIKFYLTALEKLHETLKSPEIAYQLAHVYLIGPEPDYKRAKVLIDEVLKSEEAKYLHAKTKLFLARWYDLTSDDVASCRRVIDSIKEGDCDEELLPLWKIWQAKVARDEKNFQVAEDILRSLIAESNPNTNWYVPVSAKIILAGAYVDQGKKEEARIVIAELNRLLEGKSFKTTRTHLAALEKKIDAQKALGILTFVEGINATKLIYQEQTVEVENKTSLQRLMLYLAKKKFLTKSVIVKLLYNRQRSGVTDDKLIYYHMHALRKLLGKIGLPQEAIRTEEEGYRFLPEVNIIEGEV